MYFLCFGDWGENTYLKRMVKEMVNKKNPDAILSLGDNFYDYGINTPFDPMWTTHFTTYFSKPFFAILGNHDHLGNIQAQIDYSYLNPLWIMPRRFYDRAYEDVHLIALDTYELAPMESILNATAMGYDHDTTKRFIDQLKGEEQLAWLEHVLKTSTSTWKIVFGHYPIYSNGGHGNTDELHKNLLPLLKKYNVHLYLSGHDHNICYREDGVHCLVSGCGSRQSMTHIRPGFAWLQSTGVAYVKTSPKVLEFGFYGMNGVTLMKKSISVE
jgi:tartrate-resistant acid phosphatase type 5